MKINYCCWWGYHRSLFFKTFGAKKHRKYRCSWRPGSPKHRRIFLNQWFLCRRTPPRQTFKCTFFHRVLQPSNSPCSSNHLHIPASSHGIDIYASFQLAATRRLQLLGHLLRHESCPEHLVSFMPCISLSPVSNSNRSIFHQL